MSHIYASHESINSFCLSSASDAPPASGEDWATISQDSYKADLKASNRRLDNGHRVGWIPGGQALQLGRAGGRYSRHSFQQPEGLRDAIQEIDDRWLGASSEYASYLDIFPVISDNDRRCGRMSRNRDIRLVTCHRQQSNKLPCVLCPVI